ncbi:ketopantoate reductase family protein [Halobacillus sp. Marseille-Q1614]|uniref:ketopantoate reductase family protein n=1 Tax=Halobacillus sp. Marseille-Q1614 TaxID=2709134 RepID=UPI00156EE66E|nr:2-dehydropantoate 2-reductase [Halobacillus sp. Marseille-Q1614]
MKITVAGAGAVGCFFGGTLAQAGHEVTFLSRGSHLAKMKQDGLYIKGDKQQFFVERSFTDEIQDLGSCELVLFCVKSNDTRNMAEKLKPFLSDQAFILTIQNGVENEEILKEIFSPERVLSAVTYVQAAVESPGIIRQQGRVKLVIGELESIGRSFEAVKLFQQAGIDSEHSENILFRKWSKLLWNATFNPLSAVSMARVGQILNDEQLRKTARGICAESVEVAIRLGFPFEKHSTIDKVFARAEYARDHQTSMLQDRLCGKSMEVEAMCGYLVRQGENHGISTPALQSIYSLLNFINQKNETSELIQI